MLISEEELRRRLESPKNLVNSLHVVPTRSTPEEKKNGKAPKEIRTAAGILAAVESPKVVAKELGLSPRQVYTAKRLPEVKASVEKVQDMALEMLLDSLGLLSAANLVGEKPKDISGIAANLSKIYSNVTPKQVAESNVQIMVYAPRQRQLEDFPVVEVSA